MNISSFRNRPVVNVVRMHGVIDTKVSPKSVNLATLEKSLKEAFTYRKNLKGVVLSINCPGGSPVQSEILANHIIRLKLKLQEEAKKIGDDIPVVSIVEDVAASGGYWIGLAADRILASKMSIVGSVGVISSGFGFVDAIKKLGVERRVNHAGDNKNFSDPFLPVRDEDKKYMENILTELHKEFVSWVIMRRGMMHGMHGANNSNVWNLYKSVYESKEPENEIDKKNWKDVQDLFSGKIYLGKIAEENGLIDGISSVHAWVSKFGDNTKINVVNPASKSGFIKRILGGEAAHDPSGIASIVEELRNVVDIDSQFSTPQFRGYI